MEIKYSMPLHSMWERYRDWTKKMRNDDVNAFNNQIYQYALTQPTLLYQQAIMQQLNFWNMDYQGIYLHVWFEKRELYDFLQNDVALKDLSSIKHYLYINGNNINGEIIDGNSVKSGYVRYDIALHVPNLDEGFAFSFCLMPDNTIELFFVDDDGVGQIHESEYDIAKSRNDEESLSVERDFRFAINLLAYMECFPECVRDGVPTTNNETIFHPKGRNVRLGISEKILEEDGRKGVKRPHMRKGYFKCLTSDFYKNKRGQIIFVRETMVKGKSKTVELSDDEGKKEGFKTQTSQQ